MTPQCGGLVESCDKLNTYIHLQKTHDHQTRQGTDLPLEPPFLKVTWAFDYVIKLRSCDFVKNSYLFFHKIYGN